MKKIIYFLIAVMLIPAFTELEAEAQWYGGRGRSRDYEMPVRDIFPTDCFTFCRVEYSESGGYGGYGRRGRGRGRGGWDTDFPESEENFSIRLSELTTIKVNTDENGVYKHAKVNLMEKELFNYPFIYMLEVSRLTFSEEEAKNLGEYLLRGGFLLVDDFWGTEAFLNWEIEFSKVLPPEEYPMVDIPLDHELFHIVFELNEVPQIPGIGYWYNSGGDTSEVRGWGYGDPNTEVSLKGVWDKNGRLMAVINHNSDLGDGWEEEAKNPQYFEEVSKRKAYPLGINIIVYAMTH